jgi:hypothetical protein
VNFDLTVPLIHTGDPNFAPSYELQDESPYNAFHSLSRPLSPLPSSHPYGYWTENEGKNVRALFDALARSRDVDPLVADNWYSITNQDVLRLPKVTPLAFSLSPLFVYLILSVFAFREYLF